MTYASAADMVTRFGEREVIALTDRDRSNQVNESVLQVALDSAEAEINGYLGGRYQLPLPRVPRILTGYACDMARYRLCGAECPTTDEIRDRYKDAVGFLQRVAEGKITLGGMPDGSVASPSNTVMFSNGGGRVFSRQGGGW